MAPEFDRHFRLGSWEVRPPLGELAGPDGDLHLEPKVMGVLVCLAERAGEVVSRDEFVNRVWDGRPISDEVLSRCISLLRSRLGDDSREPRYIQTVPKVGYRLIAPVSAAGSGAAGDDTAAVAAASPESVAPHRRGPFVGVFAALIVLAVVAAYLFVDFEGGERGGERPGDRPTLAVLPFGGASCKEEGGADEYLCDGLTDELINRLTGVRQLRVLARGTTDRYRQLATDIREIGRELGVRYIVHANLLRDNERIRITAQLIDVATGIALWSKRFDSRMRDIFAVQEEISTAIVDELLPHIPDNEVFPVAVQRPASVPAYDLVLRGRYHLKKRDEAPILQSIELFQRAAEVDPEYGEPYRELARAYVLLPTYSYEDPVEMFELAERMLERSVEVDPAMADSLYDIRAFLHFARWEWVEAEEDFRRALALTPNDPNLHQWYSQQLAAVGRADLALQAVLRAKEIDEHSPVVNQRLAVLYQWNDQDDRAREQFEVAREYGLGARANIEAFVVQLLRQGEYEDAKRILLDLQRVFGRASEWIDPFIAAVENPALTDEALAALSRVAADREISLKYLQGALIFLGDADAALDASFLLLSEPLDFEVEFLFAREAAPLRQHPRFGELVREIGLDRHWNVYGWPRYCTRDGENIACQ